MNSSPKKDFDDYIAELCNDNLDEGFNRNYFQSSGKALNELAKEEPKQKALESIRPSQRKQSNQKQKVAYDWDDEDDDNDIQCNGNICDSKTSEPFESFDDPKEESKEKFKPFLDETKTQSTPKKYCELACVGNGWQSQDICNNLLCTKCDVKVSIFRDREWDTTVNYMFFRNNYARKDVLSQKLKISQGMSSYSCQCDWHNIGKDRIDASALSNWVCGGHY